MSAEQLVRDLVEEVWNNGRLELMERFFAARFDHAGREDTPDGLREWHRADAQTWAGARWQVLALVSDGEQVTVRWRCTARHAGQWGPVAPTGQTLSWEGVHFFTVRNGRIVALWALSDIFGKALQLGVTLLPPEAGA